MKTFLIFDTDPTSSLLTVFLDYHFSLLTERHQIRNFLVPVFHLDPQILFDDLLAEAPLPELCEQTLGILKVFGEVFEGAFTPKSRSINKREDLGGGPLELLCSSSVLS